MSHKLNPAITVIGIDIGKNSFHVVGHDNRGAIMLRQKWSRGQGPSALAVLRLIISSNLIGCSTGMSPGFAPRKILSTWSPARRN
jgi:hypothetical protein